MVSQSYKIWKSADIYYTLDSNLCELKVLKLSARFNCKVEDVTINEYFDQYLKYIGRTYLGVRKFGGN